MFIIDVDEGTITETKHCGKCSIEKLKADEAERKIINNLENIDTGHQLAILLSLATELLNKESTITKVIVIDTFLQGCGFKPS